MRCSLLPPECNCACPTWRPAEPISALAVSPCGSLALSADSGGGLKLWSLAGGAQLAAVWGGTGSGPVTAACFLPDVAIATARGGLVSVWQSPSLELAAELAVTGGSPVCPASADTHSDGGSSTSASPGRIITALAAVGELLAVGCSDGATLMWRHQGPSEFVQHALLPAPASAAAAVTALAISRDATLLAAAAGTAVSICCTATGQLLAQQALHAAPVSLMWAGDSGQLLALMPEGRLQPLGAPEPHVPPPLLQRAGPRAAAAAVEEEDLATAGMAAGLLQPAHGAAVAAAAAVASRQKKSVRFAEAGNPLAEPAMQQARIGVPLAARHVPPPPLPSHPLLRGGVVAGHSGIGAPSQQVATASTSRGTGGSGRVVHPGRQRGAAGSGPAPRPAPPAKSVQPLYPILDLRALRGLQAATPAPVATSTAASVQAVCSPPRSPNKPASRLPPAAYSTAAPALPAAAGGGISVTRSMRHAATSTEPGTGPHMSSWQWEGQQEGERYQLVDAGGVDALQLGEAAPAPATMPFDETAEPPRRLQLPTPVQRQASPAASAQLCPVRTSKQRSGACVVQQPAPDSATAAASSASGPVSPSKQAMLAQLAAMRGEADNEAVVADAQDKSHPEADVPICQRTMGSASRPTSPVKLGVACTKEEQLKGEVQPAEVKAVAGEDGCWLSGSAFWPTLLPACTPPACLLACPPAPAGPPPDYLPVCPALILLYTQCPADLSALLPIQPLFLSAVEELDASLPLEAARRQRFARLSRRGTFAIQPVPTQQQVVQEEQQQGLQKEQQQDEEEQQLQTSSEPTVNVCVAAPAEAAHCSKGSSAACAAWTAALSADPSAAAPAAGNTAPAAAAEPASPTSFAVGSDTELNSDGEDESTAQDGHCSQALGRCPAVRHVHFASVLDGGAAGSEASAESLPGAAAAARGPAAHLSAQVAAGGGAALQPAARVMPAGQAALQDDGSIAGGAAACHGAGASPASSLLSPVAGLLRQLDSRLSSLSIRAQRQAPPGRRSPAAAYPAQPQKSAPSLLAEMAPPIAQRPAQPPPPLAAELSARLAPARVHASADASAQHGAASAAAAFAASMVPASAAIEPASALSVPAPNSRLLYLHKAALLEQQVGVGCFVSVQVAGAAGVFSWPRMSSVQACAVSSCSAFVCVLAVNKHTLTETVTSLLQLLLSAGSGSTGCCASGAGAGCPAASSHSSHHDPPWRAALWCTAASRGVSSRPAQPELEPNKSSSPCGGQEAAG